TQIVGDVRHGADRRAGIGADCLLIDGDDRGKAVDKIDVRLLELPDESFRECRHRREQPPLPFGIERVESERRFARPAHAGDDDKLVARNLDVDVSKVVFAGPTNFNGGSHKRKTTEAQRAQRGVHSPSRKYAGSSIWPWLRLVSLNGADTFS